MAVTQKQIAERLNISRSVVAHALKGYSDVAEDTRQRVQEAAREMGYWEGANREARSLVARRYGQKVRQGRIALALHEWRGALPRHMPFYGAVLNGMEMQAADLGIELCMCPTRSGELHSLIREGHVDGVISMGYKPALMELMSSSDLPVVSFQGAGPGAHSVVQDHYRGIYMTTRHLLEWGHRRIAYLGLPEPVQPSLLREKAYRDAMAEFGIEVSPKWLETSLSMARDTPTSYCEGCTECAACMGWQSLLEKNGGLDENGKPPFTAIVCYNDPIAMGVVSQARKMEVDVPADVSVTGFDDITNLYHFKPEITSANYTRDDFGRSAVQLLYEILDDRENDRNSVEKYRHVVAPVSLSVHDSTRQLSPEEA